MQLLNLGQKFQLESGSVLDDLKIAYHTFGQLNKQKDNVIWVFHAVSGDSNVLNWWPELFGSEKTYDPADYFIICANSLGSPYGSTKPNNIDFPVFMAS